MSVNTMDIYQKLEAGYYDPPHPGHQAPRRPARPQWKTVQEHLAEIEEYIRKEAEFDRARALYNTSMKGHRELCAAREAEWQSDLRKALGIEGHPKAERLLSIAYDEKHGHGRREVLDSAETLSELLK